MSERLLVVVADDLGLGAEVDRGILEAHQQGVVTAASALVVGPTFEATASAVGDLPRLDVGVHLALVGPDRPVTDPGRIPSLVDSDGAFAPSWSSLLPRVVAGRVRLDEVAQEWRAQVQRARAAGITPTHLDTHQHVHAWPTLARVLVTVAREERVPVVRVPRGRRPGAGWALAALGRRLARRLDAAGLAHADDFAGWDHAGRHTVDDVVATVEALGRRGARTAELALHPGHPDATAERRYGWGYRWGDELAAALDPEVHEAVARAGFTLVGTSALARPA